MAPPYSNDALSPRSRVGQDTTAPSMFPFSSMPGFDILDWQPAYQSCQRYFLDHAQYEAATQALCSLINIRLPHQWRINPIMSSTTTVNVANQSTANVKDWSRPTSGPSAGRDAQGQPSAISFVSLIPYIRRLIVTGFDTEGILHGFFGDAWQSGITPLRECERRNYLFAAKHGGWGSCKNQYDLNEEETVPFMQPLKDVTAEELNAAEKGWSSWLALEDWMVGPRAPRDNRGLSGNRYGQSSGMGGSSRYAQTDGVDGVHGIHGG
ncbi:hypothetical protein BDZ85DRAFT_217497 [Elsinoe ampelina]|uniref:Ilp is an apoptosis inhibitor n=1 Tax=Elsinoe ampelina TaxID=302913 RepID=A0A6A6GD48_9PEZI|nr:hypothetical protein BDZ85DRAFT_217497 [Elsinoe ampelina]